MLRPLSSPAIVPSRVELIHDACAALDSSARVFITGDQGIGLTTFGTRLLKLRRDGQREVHRLTGSQALTDIPFASVAALGAQVHGLRDLGHLPAEMIGRIAQLASLGRRTLFLDRAEFIDAASSAALVQLAELGVFELIVGYSEPAALPEDLRRLTFEHGTAMITLQPLTLDDTLTLLEDLMGFPFEVSSARRLLELAGGNPLLVRELALDAQANAMIRQHRGYLSVELSWRAKSSRVSQLLRNRLEAQPEVLREAVELTAVLGELPREIASRMLSLEQIEGALNGRLLSLVPGDNTMLDKLVLGAGLAPETVVSVLGIATLAAMIERLRAEVPAELLTPNMRVQLATLSRSVGIEVSLGQLVADSEAAAQSRQFDAVIALTDGLDTRGFPETIVEIPGATQADAESWLRMFRSEAFLETGAPEIALEVLRPLLTKGYLDATLFASYIEFSGLGRPDLMQKRLTEYPGQSESVGPPELAALRAILTARAGEHVSLETLQKHSSDERLTHSLRLSIAAQLVAEFSYLGSPGEGLAEFKRLREGELWRESPSSQRGELLHTLLIAIQCDGAADQSYSPLLAGIDWDDLALDHSAFLSAKGMQSIERGEAAEAAELLTQASALVEQRDPHLLAGFISVLDAAAAVLLGDLSRARTSYAQYLTGSITSGQVARLEAVRLSLLVTQAIEGDDAARRRLEEMLAEADRRCHRHTRMRLLHEGWRLRLVDASKTATELGAVAEGVQGPFAGTLHRYADAFGEQPQQNRTQAHSALDAIIFEHLAAGRRLYAAEAAARGAEIAKSLAERKRASQLLDACAAAAQPLAGVHTPSLRRVQIDAAALSDREFEVCMRAAVGLSNMEIAEERFLSPRTVEGHLQRAYSKLGVTDRRMLLLPL